MGAKQGKNFNDNGLNGTFPKQNMVNPYGNFYYPNMQYLNGQTYPQSNNLQTMQQTPLYQNYTLPASFQYPNFKMPPSQTVVPHKFHSQPLTQTYCSNNIQNCQYPAKAASVDGSYGLSCSSSTIPSVSSQNSHNMPSNSFIRQ